MKMTDYKNYVEEVYDWANNYNYYSHLVVKSNTSFALINQQGVTEQRIQQGSNHTQHDKYFIPQMKKYRVSITQTFKISQTFTPNFSIKSYVSKTRKPIKTSSKACWNWSQCSQWACFSNIRRFTPGQGTKQVEQMNQQILLLFDFEEKNHRRWGTSEEFQPHTENR